MWIERIKLEGFGGIAGEQIDFAEHELNLIIEPNEYGKSTVAECIWATLFDFPDHGSHQRGSERESFRPWDEKAAFRAHLELTFNERPIAISRDFHAGTVQVIDRNTKDDITQEFLGPNGEDHIGLAITGMSRDMFRSTCLLGQRHLDAHHAANQADIATVFQGMADTASPASSAAGVIETISGALADYSYFNKRGTLESAIKDLENNKSELEAKLHQMNQEQIKVAQWMQELDRIEAEDASEPTAEPETPTPSSEETKPQPAPAPKPQSTASGLRAALEARANSPTADLDASVVAEYDGLKSELDEVTRSFEATKRTYERKLLLEQELRDLDMTAPVQSSLIFTLQELWTRRNSRFGDAERLALEIEPQQEEYERLEQEISDRYQSVENMTLDEANTLSGLAVNMYKLQQEMQDLQKELQEQTGRHKLKLMQSSAQHGTALDVLKALNREEIEEAKNYSSLLLVFHEQILEEQKRLQETKFSLDDIEERRKAKRNSNLGKSIGVFVFAIVLGIFLASTHDLPSIPDIVKIFCVGLMLLSLLAAITIFGMVLPPNYKYFLKEDFESATEQEAKHRKALATAKTKVANLEAKLTALAVKTGASGKEELLRYINDASSHESVMEEQSSSEQKVETHEARLKKVQKDLSYYFEKAGRDPNQVDSQRAMDLAQEIQQLYKEKDALNQQFQEIHNVRKQLDFLVSEIEGIDQEIRQRLSQGGIEVGEGVEALAAQLNKLTEFSSERQGVLNELSKVDYELAKFDNTYDAIMSMDARMDVLKDKIRNLIADYPGLEGLPEPEERDNIRSIIPWGSDLGAASSSETESDASNGSTAATDTESGASALKPAATKDGGATRSGAANARREEILVALRTQLNNRDEHYLDAIEELARVDHELVCARRAKLALEMARDVIRTLSSETYKHWSDELNEMAGEIITELGMDIESLQFDNSLHLNLKLKGQERQFSSADIVGRLSTGMREQIHWLARIIVSRYLSRHHAIPIILDEPFSEADDSRFLSMMRFLITSIAPHNQIVIMSCHQQRHQWLVTQLQDSEKRMITFKRRQPLTQRQGKEAEAVAS